MSTDEPLEAIDLLSGMIVTALSRQRAEETFPGHDPDRMDDKIANCRRRVMKLRKIREELEDEMTWEL